MLAMFFAPLDEKIFVLLVIVLIFIGLDVLVGVARSFMLHEFSTAKLREGIVHKATLIVILLLAWLCDTAMLHVPELGMRQFILFAAEVIMFFMELTSIFESLVKLNPSLSESRFWGLFSGKVDSGSTDGK